VVELLLLEGADAAGVKSCVATVDRASHTITGVGRGNIFVGQ